MCRRGIKLLLLFAALGAPSMALAVAPNLNPDPFNSSHAGPNRRPPAGDQCQPDRHRGCPVGRRQCLDAGLRRPGPPDDRARPGPLLRRPGAQKEHSGHHDAEFRHDVPGYGSLGHRRLFAGLRPRQRIRGRLRASLPSRRRSHTQHRLRAHHPRADPHGLPVDVRHHHPGAYLRRICRAHEVQLHGGLSIPLVLADLLSHGPHGLGRWRIAQLRQYPRPLPQPGFRGWHCGPHHQRRLGAGLLPLPGQAHRVPADQDAAPLHGAQLYRRLPAVGRLVRLQCRQRPRPPAPWPPAPSSTPTLPLPPPPSAGP